jgi:Dolichyl-phosphate-mannose-protein mannosyltransferase
MNDTTARRWSRALGRVLWEHRWLWVLLVTAFAVRLHWNLVVHPIEDYVYSDMRGYVRRADALFEAWWEPHEYDAFYPYGTHVLMYVVQAVFGDGPDDFRTLGIAYAVIGAAVVGFGYLLARRVSHHRFVPPLVGAVLVAYYPLISFGGYALSEVPFSFCLVSSTYFLVRMAQGGKKRDAWAAGTLAAFGMVIRPQILASIGLLGLFWLVARRRMPKLRLAVMLHALLPILLVMAFSAWRLHFHTGRYGLISENGKFNQVFGRCHNTKIFALPDSPKRRRTSFGPPPLIQLAKREEKLPHAWPGLDPALEIEITYTGYIGDSKILGDIIDRCIAKTGWWKQAEYSLVNVLLLWRYNVAWPDSGKPEWRAYASRWGKIHASAFAVPALLFVVVAVFVRRRATGLALVALHIVGLVIVAASIFGDTRLRTPYDPFILILAIEAYATALWLIWTWGQRFMRRRRLLAPAPPDPAKPPA